MGLKAVAQSLAVYTQASDKAKATAELEMEYGKNSKTFLLVALNTIIIKSKISADEVDQLRALVNQITDTTPSPLTARAKTIGDSARPILNKHAQEKIENFEILSLKNLIKNKLAAYEQTLGQSSQPIVTGLPSNGSFHKGRVANEDDDDKTTFLSIDSHNSSDNDSYITTRTDEFPSPIGSPVELEDGIENPDNSLYERIEALAEIGITDRSVADSKPRLSRYIDNFEDIHKAWVKAGSEPEKEPWLDELLVDFNDSNEFKELVTQNKDFAHQPSDIKKLLRLNTIYVEAQKSLSKLKHKDLEPNETRQLMTLLVLALNINTDLLVRVSDASIDELDDNVQAQAIYTKIHLESALEFLVTNTQT